MQHRNKQAKWYTIHIIEKNKDTLSEGFILLVRLGWTCFHFHSANVFIITAFMFDMAFLFPCLFTDAFLFLFIFFLSLSFSDFSLFFSSFCYLSVWHVKMENL